MPPPELNPAASKYLACKWFVIKSETKVFIAPSTPLASAINPQSLCGTSPLINSDNFLHQFSFISFFRYPTGAETERKFYCTNISSKKSPLHLEAFHEACLKNGELKTFGSG